MLKRAALFIGFCLLVGIWGPAAHAQTINAASCNASDVQNALNSVSSATTTVVIPSGTCTWTTEVSYSVPASVTSLTIQGQTAVNCTGSAGTSSFACTATDNTVLVDSYATENEPILNIKVGSAAFRMTGITFQGGNVGTNIGKPNGFLTISANTTSFRIDHCNFNATTYTGTNSMSGLTIFGEAYGVVDHSTFEMWIEGNGVRYYQGPGEGDTTWSQPSQWGSANFLFAENDIFEYGGANDCDYGGRMVIRYSTIIANSYDGDTGLWQGHQINQGDQRKRGCRALEIYHNYVLNPNPSIGSEYSVGGGAATALVWNNTISTGYKYDVNLWDAREAATGHIATDAPAGIGYCGTGSDGVASPWDGNSNSQGYPCLDQTGRGQGDLVSGEFPNMIDTLIGTESWPHQLLEPWYIWNENIASGQIVNTPSYDSVYMVANRDFYVQASPFNGTSGVGAGLLSARPSTCTPGPGGTYGQSPTGSYGVGYWATDANGGNGELYVCTSTNTWTAMYTPYMYPHPLVSGGTVESNAPNPPTGLVATIQ